MSKVIFESEKRITNDFDNGHNGVDLGYRANEEQNKVYSNCEKGKGNAFAVCKIKCRSDELFRSVGIHYTEAEILTSCRNIAVKAVFAAEVAKTGGRLDHYRKRRHYFNLPLGLASKSF